MTWNDIADPWQLPPDDERHDCGCGGPDPDWQTWLIAGPRACGKSRVAAEWLARMALARPETRCTVVAADQDACERILAGATTAAGEAVAEAGRHATVLVNGSVIGISGPHPRGLSRDSALVCEEIGWLENAPEAWLRLSIGQDRRPALVTADLPLRGFAWDLASGRVPSAGRVHLTIPFLPERSRLDAGQGARWLEKHGIRASA